MKDIPPPQGMEQESMLGEEDPGAAFDPVLNTFVLDPGRGPPPLTGWQGVWAAVWPGLVVLFGGLALDRYVAARRARKSRIDLGR